LLRGLATALTCSSMRRAWDREDQRFQAEFRAHPWQDRWPASRQARGIPAPLPPGLQALCLAIGPIAGSQDAIRVDESLAMGQRIPPRDYPASGELTFHSNSPTLAGKPGAHGGTSFACSAHQAFGFAAASLTRRFSGAWQRLMGRAGTEDRTISRSRTSSLPSS
jgi:hypothetical protein